MLAKRIVGLCGVRARGSNSLAFADHIGSQALSYSSTMWSSAEKLWKQQASGPFNEEEPELGESAVEKKDSIG